MKTYTIDQIEYMVSLGRIYRNDVEIGRLHDCSDAPGSGSPYATTFTIEDSSYRLYGNTLKGLLEEVEKHYAARISPRAISKDLQEIQKQTTLAHARIAEKLEGIAEDCRIILRDLKEIEEAK